MFNFWTFICFYICHNETKNIKVHKRIAKSQHTELPRLEILRRLIILKGAISVIVPDMDLGMYEIVD